MSDLLTAHWTAAPAMEPMPEAGPMHPDIAAALARAKAQVEAAHKPSDDTRTPGALVALGQDSTADTIPTEEPR